MKYPPRLPGCVLRGQGQPWKPAQGRNCDVKGHQIAVSRVFVIAVKNPDPFYRGAISHNGTSDMRLQCATLPYTDSDSYMEQDGIANTRQTVPKRIFMREMDCHISICHMGRKTRVVWKARAAMRIV